MKMHTYRTLLWGMSVLGVVCFIFANSLLPAAASSEESSSFLAFFLNFFPSATHHFIRKLAHVAEYALLGAHFAFFPLVSPFSGRITYPVFLLFGAVIALLDEGIQSFVPGRGASLVDVLIDFGGYLAALLLVLAVLFLHARLRKEKTDA